MKALIIIDVQNVMFSYQDGVYKGKEVIDCIKQAIKKARRASAPIIYIQHVVDETTQTTDTSGDWAIYSDIYPQDGDRVIQKRTCDSFHETVLADTLNDLGVNEIVYTGMQTEFCVDTTCRRSFSMGYKGQLLRDGHTTFDSEDLSADKIIAHHNTILNGRFLELITIDDLTF